MLEALDWNALNNPFLHFSDYAIYNPGTLEMALPVVEERIVRADGGQGLSLGMIVGRKS